MLYWKFKLGLFDDAVKSAAARAKLKDYDVERIELKVHSLVLELTGKKEPKAALEDGVPARLGLRKMLSAVSRCRGLKKADMVNNSYLPRMEVDTETYEVRADGQLLTCEPARVLPMAQRYYLF